MGSGGLAAKLDVAPIEAQELLDLHRRTYKKFWDWSGRVVDSAMLTNQIMTVFGWKQHLGRDPLGRAPNSRALMNFPMQGNGAEMMRIAAIAGTEAGIEVCAPVHDAFLIAAPLERLDEDTARMRELMTRAGRAVTGCLDVRTEAKITRWPDRYVEEEGTETWSRVMGVLNRLDRKGG